MSGRSYGRAPFLLAGDVRQLERLELDQLELGLLEAVIAALRARLEHSEHLRAQAATWALWGALWAQLERLEGELERRRRWWLALLELSEEARR